MRHGKSCSSVRPYSSPPYACGITYHSSSVRMLDAALLDVMLPQLAILAMLPHLLDTLCQLIHGYSEKLQRCVESFLQGIGAFSSGAFVFSPTGVRPSQAKSPAAFCWGSTPHARSPLLPLQQYGCFRIRCGPCAERGGEACAYVLYHVLYGIHGSGLQTQ